MSSQELKGSAPLAFANFVCTALAIICFAGFLFGLATGQVKPGLSFYPVLGAGGVISLACLWLPIGPKLAFAFFAMVFFFGAVVFEAGVTLIEVVDTRLGPPVTPMGPFAAAAKAAGKPFDNRTPLQVVSQLRAGGIPAVAPVNFLTEKATAPDEIWPLAGIANRYTVFCNETGVYATYQSDRFGFNNPDAVFNRSQFDIAIVGNSFAHGACVNQDQSIVAAIRAVDPSTASFGWIADGPLAELAAIREYAAPFRPKDVLWFYVGNDQATLEDEKAQAALDNYLSPAYRQDLIDRQADIDRLVEQHLDADLAARIASPPSLSWPSALHEVAAMLQLKHLRSAFGVVKDRIAGPPLNPVSARDFAMFSQILSEAHREVAAWGGTSYFVFLPDYDLLMHRDEPSYVNRYGIPNGDREKVLAIARDAGMTVIDLYPVMTKEKDSAQFFPYGMFAHYTADTDAMVGRYIASQLDILSPAQQ